MLEVTWAPFTLYQICSVSEFIQVNWNSSWSKFHWIQDKENQTIFIHVSYCWEFIRTPLFTQVQMRSVFRFVQLSCKFTWINAFTRWYKRVGAYYLGDLIFIHFFLSINFYSDWSQPPYCVWANQLIQTNIYKVLQTRPMCVLLFTEWFFIII